VMPSQNTGNDHDVISVSAVAVPNLSQNRPGSLEGARFGCARGKPSRIEAFEACNQKASRVLQRAAHAFERVSLTLSSHLELFSCCAKECMIGSLSTQPIALRSSALDAFCDYAFDLHSATVGLDAAGDDMPPLPFGSKCGARLLARH
jgi:hypothetical protein